MDCCSTFLSHAQTCDNVSVQIATEWIPSVHIFTCPSLCDYDRVQYVLYGASVHILHMSKTCDNVGVQSAMEWTPSIYISYTGPNL